MDGEVQVHHMPASSLYNLLHIFRSDGLGVYVNWNGEKRKLADIGKRIVLTFDDGESVVITQQSNLKVTVSAPLQ